MSECVYCTIAFTVYTHNTHIRTHTHNTRADFELQKHILQYYMYTEVLERKRVKMAASVLRI